MSASAPLCPSCGQPGTLGFAGPTEAWECRNEACPEFGQPLQEAEPPPRDPPEPGDEAPGRRP